MKKLKKVLMIILLSFLLGASEFLNFSSSNTNAASELSGKKLLVDGDSIAQGVHATSEGRKPYYSYAHYLGEEHGMKVTNVAIGGSRFYWPDGKESKIIPKHLVSSVKKTSYDYILLEGGSNDVHYARTNLNKTYLALRDYFKTVTTNSKWETAKIGFIIVPHPDHARKKYDKSMQEYEKKLWKNVKKICDEYSIPYIDFYEKDYLMKSDGTFDGLHPSKKIQQTMGKAIAKWMASLPNYKYKVSFNLNGLSTKESVDEQMVTHKKMASKPTITVTDSKKKFKYWSTKKNGSEFNFNTKITKNLTLYAVYETKTGDGGGSGGGSDGGGGGEDDEDPGSGDEGEEDGGSHGSGGGGGGEDDENPGSGDEGEEDGGSHGSGGGGSSGQGSGSDSSQGGGGGSGATDDICDIEDIPDIVRASAGCDKKEDTLDNKTLIIIDGIISVFGLIAVIYIVVGGVKYMTSQGDPGKLAQAKKTILYAVIGLAICALAIAIVNWVIGVIS